MVVHSACVSRSGVPKAPRSDEYHQESSKPVHQLLLQLLRLLLDLFITMIAIVVVHVLGVTTSLLIGLLQLKPHLLYLVPLGVALDLLLFCLQ